MVVALGELHSATVVRWHSGKRRGGTDKAPPLPEDLQAITGCWEWGRVIFFAHVSVSISLSMLL